MLSTPNLAGERTKKQQRWKHDITCGHTNIGDRSRTAEAERATYSACATVNMLCGQPKANGEAGGGPTGRELATSRVGISNLWEVGVRETLPLHSIMLGLPDSSDSARQHVMGRMPVTTRPRGFFFLQKDGCLQASCTSILVPLQHFRLF